MIVPLEPLSVRKKPHYAIFCILSLYYHLQYFLCENVSKAINGQLHRLAINSSVIVACFYLQNCTDSQPLGIVFIKWTDDNSGASIPKKHVSSAFSNGSVRSRLPPTTRPSPAHGVTVEHLISP